MTPHCILTETNQEVIFEAILSKCKSLIRLQLGPGVSVEAAKKLKASLPDCHIDLFGANSHQEIKLP